MDDLGPRDCVYGRPSSFYDIFEHFLIFWILVIFGFFEDFWAYSVVVLTLGYTFKSKDMTLFIRLLILSFIRFWALKSCKLSL